MELNEALKQATTKPTNPVVLVKNLKTCNCIWKNADTCKSCKMEGK